MSIKETSDEHPDEVYTIVGLDFNYDDPYILSGYMSDTNWGSDELIHVPEPTSRFELLKNMTLEEMSRELMPMITELCEEGVPTEAAVLEWLSGIDPYTPAKEEVTVLFYRLNKLLPHPIGSNTVVDNDILVESEKEAFDLFHDGYMELSRTVSTSHRAFGIQRWNNTRQVWENGDAAVCHYIIERKASDIPGGEEEKIITKDLSEAFQLADGRHKLSRIIKIENEKRAEVWDYSQQRWAEQEGG